MLYYVTNHILAAAELRYECCIPESLFSSSGHGTRPSDMECDSRGQLKRSVPPPYEFGICATGLRLVIRKVTTWL